MGRKRKSKLIGYARVSKHEQDLHLQIDELEKAGVSKKMIFTDKASGARADRPGLDKCLDTLHEGDVLLVWRIDRIGRNMKHLVELVEGLKDRGVGFRSITDGVIDTTTASGELIFNIFASLAQFERQLIRERTRAGLKAARARGKNGGRKRVLPDDPRVLMAKKLHEDISNNIDDICATLKISKPTLYRWLKL